MLHVHIGGDHAAFDLKAAIIAHLREGGYHVKDHGPFDLDPIDDYPVFVLPTALGVAKDLRDGKESLGIVLGGSGNGEQIAANKVKGIRAALASSTELAQLARQHNDAQVLSIGARFTPIDDALKIVDAFLTTPFSEEERHQRRLAMVEDFERTGEASQPH